jgi:hypothetical protein
MIPTTVTMRMSPMLPGLILLGVTSCDSTDHRLTEFAQRSSDQQAQQNERLAEQATAIVKQGHEVAAAAHDLVAQDAAARRELLEAQQQFQQQALAERIGLDRDRREMDRVRQAAADAAIRDPVIGQAILTVGMAMAALIPLVLTTLALRKLPDHSATERLLNELLLDLWTNNGGPGVKTATVVHGGYAPRLSNADNLPADDDAAAR